MRDKERRYTLNGSDFQRPKPGIWASVKPWSAAKLAAPMNAKTMGFVMAIVEPTEGKAMIQGLGKMMSANTGPVC